MNTPTPETDDLIKTLIETRGMSNAVYTAEITSKCEMLEQQRDAALEDLAFRRDLYKVIEEGYQLQSAELAETRRQRNAALDALRSIESMANNPQDMPWLTLEFISITARKILASPDESPTN